MEKEKKKWETPKLICLYRGRPEEAVLQGCKGDSGALGGPQGNNCKLQQGVPCALTASS